MKEWALPEGVLTLMNDSKWTFVLLISWSRLKRMIILFRLLWGNFGHLALFPYNYTLLWSIHEHNVHYCFINELNFANKFTYFLRETIQAHRPEGSFMFFINSTASAASVEEPFSIFSILGKITHSLLKVMLKCWNFQKIEYTVTSSICVSAVVTLHFSTFLQNRT